MAKIGKWGNRKMRERSGNRENGEIDKIREMGNGEIENIREAEKYRKWGTGNW